MPEILSSEDVDLVQERLSLLLASFCFDRDFAQLLERYIEQSQPQANGSLDAVLPHFMSLRDMREAQVNLRYFISVAEKVLEVRALIQEHTSEAE
jgi:hypothetical protein